jgi:large subunit ribosomal protein L15
MDIAKAKSGVKGRHARKRVGRGIGSGHGKTSGKGHKGQKARSSPTVKLMGEGGQRPLFRRLPKRGFNNKFRTEYQVVNVGDLNCFDAGTKVDFDVLYKAKLIRGRIDRVKILGNGEIDRALTVTAAKFSESAVKKITAAGGSTEVA